MLKTISSLSLSSILGAALFAASAVSGSAPAAANPAEDQIIAGFCDGNPADECNAWRNNRAGWGEPQYQSFYNTHVGVEEFSTPEAKEAFGRSDTGPVPGAEGANVNAPPVNTNGQSGTGQPATAPAGSTDTSGVPEVIGDSPNHVADCQASFKSYNPATDTYVGLDGQVHKCKL